MRTPPQSPSFILDVMSLLVLCRLLVPDLTPNIGLFWYFFIEIFEHFRVFFLSTFQLHVFLYVLPLAVKLR